mgnify:CR=1 FL=1
MKWENNINHDLREVDYTVDDWKTLVQDRDVWRAYVRTGHESTGSIVPVKLLDSCTGPNSNIACDW